MGNVERELVELHEQLVTWMNGACADTDAEFEQRIGCRMGEVMEVAPGGRRIEASALLSMLRSAHGSNPEFRIAISDIRVVFECADALVATCIEWQRNAKQSTPPDNGRVLTIVFAKDPECPHGLRWEHLHETWLPADEMAARVYDF